MNSLVFLITRQAVYSFVYPKEEERVSQKGLKNITEKNR